MNYQDVFQRFPKTTVALLADVLQSDVSCYIRDPKLINPGKVRKLEKVLARLRFILNEVLPRLERQIAPLKVDLKEPHSWKALFEGMDSSDYDPTEFLKQLDALEAQ
jgi:hypothetical protein